MESKEIISTIKDMISSNEKEAKRTLAEMEPIQKNCVSIQKQVKNKTCNINDLMIESSKLLILKDKAIVHKAAVTVLSQLLGKIDG
jgi:hypothetical protein